MLAGGADILVPMWMIPIPPSVAGLSRPSEHGSLSSIIHTLTHLLSRSALQTMPHILLL